MPEAVLHLPGTLSATCTIRAQVEEDLEEAAFEDEDLEADDWDDLEEPDELEFDENGNDWDEDLEEEFEGYVAEDGDDDDKW